MPLLPGWYRYSPLLVLSSRTLTFVCFVFSYLSPFNLCSFFALSAHHTWCKKQHTYWLLTIVCAQLHKTAGNKTYTGRQDIGLFCRNCVVLINLCVHWLISSRLLHKAHRLVTAWCCLHHNVCCQFINLSIHHMQVLIIYTYFSQTSSNSVIKICYALPPAMINIFILNWKLPTIYLLISISKYQQNFQFRLLYFIKLQVMYFAEAISFFLS